VQNALGTNHARRWVGFDQTILIYYVIFRDHTSGHEFIRNCHELCEQGLYNTELDAYKYHVFLDFRIFPDNELGIFPPSQKS
jgi:hypothetical protein